ncbi:MAG: 6-pyruvoyl tetrahydropterin synthase family protein [Gemmatimonadales bacterium]
MGHYQLSAETSFSAAHTLPGVDLCERFHGHNWNVRLTVRVDEPGLDKTGMGIDFRVIEQTVRDAVEDWDHRYLNDVEPFRDIAPTAENIARVLCDRAAESLAGNGNVSVAEVEVWETPKYRVIYRPG